MPDEVLGQKTHDDSARRKTSWKAGPAARATPDLRLIIHAMALAKTSNNVPCACHVEELCCGAFEGSCYDVYYHRSQ